MSPVYFAVFLAVLSMCNATPFFGYGFGMSSRPATQLRCPSTAKPCRIKVEMTSPSLGFQVSESNPCSCADSKPCLTDWNNQDHVITRQLRTASHISMTLSMMFCDVIMPQRQCESGEVALQVAGLSIIPNEVDFVNCACADGRPLQLHEQFHGDDHKQYMSYVCNEFKPVCRTGWMNRQACLVSDAQSSRMSYPCKCPSGYSCRANAYEGPYKCRRG